MTHQDTFGQHCQAHSSFVNRAGDIRDMGQSHTPPCCWDRKPWSSLFCNGPGGKQESPEESIE